MAMTALGVAAGETRILATDVSTRVLATARAAVYDIANLGDVPTSLRTTAFVPLDRERATVGPRVRALVSFASLNLLGSWPMRGPFHAILCRNVMIYFGKSTRETLVERFRSLLVPGGLLFFGLSESLTGLEHELTLAEPGVYVA
jgi:chemotaxis protein methyltransferase CheR